MPRAFRGSPVCARAPSRPARLSPRALWRLSVWGRAQAWAGSPEREARLKKEAWGNRADVDIHTVRIHRNRLAHLQTDHQAAMKQVEQALYAYHANIKNDPSKSQVRGAAACLLPAKNSDSPLSVYPVNIELRLCACALREIRTRRHITQYLRAREPKRPYVAYVAYVAYHVPGGCCDICASGQLMCCSICFESL